MSSIKDAFVEIGAGKPVYREGDAGSEMYVIESGQVELASKAHGTTGVLGPGDFFGIDFLLEGKLRLNDATVKENARLLRLPRAALAQVIAENPEIAIGIMRRLLESQRDSAASAPVAPAQAAQPAPPVRATAAPAAAAKAPPPAAPAEAPRKSAPPPAPVPAPAPVASPVAPPAPAVAKTFVLRHVATGEVLPLESGRSEFLVGRPDPASGTQPEIDLGPYDQNRSLSRRHARILQRDGVYFVREEGNTTNGTYVNGERIATSAEVALKPDDKIRFGTIEVEFVSV
jgi:hypothetical protein